MVAVWAGFGHGGQAGSEHIDRSTGSHSTAPALRSAERKCERRRTFVTGSGGIIAPTSVTRRSTMNKSMLIGGIFGAAIATAGAGIAGYQALKKPDFADVIAVQPVVEKIESPRQVCHDEQRTRQKPVKDQHQITGTVVGAVAGGLLGDAIGGGGKNTGAKVAGAVVGGYAGNKAQEHIQATSTESYTKTVCTTVVDVSEKTVGYDVTYRIGDETGQVRMDRDPGAAIPLQNGVLVLAQNTVR